MKALIAMSGGVDSSVTAKLVQDAGYECVGCTMQLFSDEDAPEGSPDNVKDAGAIADRLSMPYYVFDYRELFRCQVIDPFIEAYANGRTPNPCLDCNRELKFGQLLREAEKLGCSHIATGHYARIEKDEKTGRYLLKKGLDETKDQSYVLYALTQEQMEHVLLPLGSMRKSEVREIAEASGFVNADRPDSQDICFVPDGDYASVIRRTSDRDFPQGEFVDLDGNPIGTHKGIIHYTIGQTRRLGQAFGRPRYVCRIDAEHNRIYLGGPDDVYSSHAKAGRFNWISGIVPEGEIRCRVRTRYKQKEQWATVKPVPEETLSASDGIVEILFDEPQRAITPGQAAVLYDEDICLGGGRIL